MTCICDRRCPTPCATFGLCEECGCLDERAGELRKDHLARSRIVGYLPFSALKDSERDMWREIARLA